MNSEEIIAILQKEFPGKNIIQLPLDNPSEIICEVEPTANHPEISSIIAVIDESKPHYHLKSTETYFIEKGELHLFVDGRKYLLREGDTYVVEPGRVHWAEGEATRVRVNSSPGWTQEDHILIAKI
ncbi:MAG: cupin domain-containing protein [Candidatus Colwellbacteria bacterium]|nr:cupin domain-containing protein [Candidatus Colwellbacteria bacterium]